MPRNKSLMSVDLFPCVPTTMDEWCRGHLRDCFGDCTAQTIGAQILVLALMLISAVQLRPRGRSFGDAGRKFGAQTGSTG